MKHIGYMADGSKLILVSPAELQLFMAIEDFNREVLRSPLDEAGPVATAPVVDPPVSRQNRRPKAVAHKKTESPTLNPRSKTCVICRGNFHDDSRTNSRKTCGQKSCKKGLKNRYLCSLRNKLKSGQAASPAPLIVSGAPNPSNPFLTNEEREKIKTDRLAGIQARRP